VRVTMKAAVSGSRNGQSWPAIGETIDLPDEEAVHLVEAKIAEPAGEDESEKAVVEDDTEKATPRRKPASK